MLMFCIDRMGDVNVEILNASKLEVFCFMINMDGIRFELELTSSVVLSFILALYICLVLGFHNILQ